jgi:hypothetical protein
MEGSGFAFKVLSWYLPGWTEDNHKNLIIAGLQAEV